MQSSEEPLFYVQPGSQKNNVAVQVIDEIKGGSSDDE